MESKTKTKISVDQINSMIRAAFDEKVLPIQIVELTDGCFNSAFKLILNNGERVVLKIAPAKDIKVMRYEDDLMKVEVWAIRKASELEGVPIPKVIYYDDSVQIIENEYFIMEYVEGTPLNKLFESISENKLSKIYSDLGNYVKRINSIRGDYFGSISSKGKRFKSWGETFLFMIEEVLQDASEVNVALPLSNSDILKIVRDNMQKLNSVSFPSLVHKDLWAGNIFVDEVTGEITGLIDFERAVFGDRLLEVACASLTENASFLKSYMGESELNKDEKLRAILYRIYLYLTMVVECPFRHDEGEFDDTWIRDELDKALEEYFNFTIG